MKIKIITLKTLVLFVEIYTYFDKNWNSLSNLLHWNSICKIIIKYLKKVKYKISEKSFIIINLKSNEIWFNGHSYVYI